MNEFCATNKRQGDWLRQRNKWHAVGNSLCCSHSPYGPPFSMELNNHAWRILNGSGINQVDWAVSAGTQYRHSDLIDEVTGSLEITLLAPLWREIYTVSNNKSGSQVYAIWGRLSIKNQDILTICGNFSSWVDKAAYVHIHIHIHTYIQAYTRSIVL